MNKNRTYKYVPLSDVAANGRVSGVYLLHFDEAIGTDKQSARHYVGSSPDVFSRVNDHMKGKSDAAKIVKYVVDQGIGVRLARVWPTDDNRDARLGLEYTIKSRKKTPMYCPFCTGDNAHIVMVDVSVFDESMSPYDDVPVYEPAAELSPDDTAALMRLPF